MFKYKNDLLESYAMKWLVQGNINEVKVKELVLKSVKTLNNDCLIPLDTLL